MSQPCFRISVVFRKFAARRELLVIASLLHGCSPVANSTVTPSRSGQGASGFTSVPRTVVTTREALTVDELHDRGMRRFSDQQYALAAQDLETATAAAPELPWVPTAYYTAAIARDLSGSFSACSDDLRKVVDHPQVTPEQRDAHLRLVRVLVYLERWQEAGQRAEAMLQRYQNLRTLESIVVLGAKALAELADDKVDQAERDVEEARSLIEQGQFQLPVKLHRDVAVIYFALGEIRLARAEGIRFVPPPADFADRLERRCQLVLDAQSAYSNSMRAYDSHWSLMAGYRVGLLYAHLHSDLMAMLSEISFESPERERLFEAALRMRYSVLLTKAVDLMQHTLSLASRTEDDSSWVELTRRSYFELKESLAKEEAALRQVPFSRDELRAALDGLKKNPKKNGGAKLHPKSQ